MGEVKHTPGPWKLEVNEKSATVRILGRRGDGNVRSLDGLGDLVSIDCAADPDAVMFSPLMSEQVANAHLIAAAPDMMAALKLVMQHGRVDDSEERMSIVGAAILKAEGSPNA